jgi:hypothetical protein
LIHNHNIDKHVLVLLPQASTLNDRSSILSCPHNLIIGSMRKALALLRGGYFEPKRYTCYTVHATSTILMVSSCFPYATFGLIARGKNILRHPFI